MPLVDYQITDGDIVIHNGDIATVDGSKSTRQRIEQKLLLWRGEWFLDTTAGFPWLQNILGKKPRPEVVVSLVRQLVEADPGIRSVESVDLEPVDSTRQLAISIRATYDDRATDTIEVTI